MKTIYRHIFHITKPVEVETGKGQVVIRIGVSKVQTYRTSLFDKAILGGGGREEEYKKITFYSVLKCYHYHHHYINRPHLHD